MTDQEETNKLAEKAFNKAYEALSDLTIFLQNTRDYNANTYTDDLLKTHEMAEECWDMLRKCPLFYEPLLPEDIENIIEKSGLSKQEVAEKIGVKPPYISKWCSGYRTPSRENQEKLLELLKP